MFEMPIRYLHDVSGSFVLIISRVVGVPTLEVGSQQLHSLPEIDTFQSRALHALMDIIRRQRGRFIPLQVSSLA